jgi:hypothetical protein
MAQKKLTILFSGMIAGVPWQGGATWAVLQYLLGLRALGHTVQFVEPVAASALLPAGASLADSVNAAYFRSVMAEYGLEQSAALLLAGTIQTLGLPYDRLRAVARGADLLINIAGMLTDESLISHAPIRAYLDLDPAFTQLWQEAQGIDMRFAGHTHFVTVGQAIGRDGCMVPTCGRTWITTLQPVALAHWPECRTRPRLDAFTTVANWRGYGSIEYGSVFYGQKAHALRRLMALPTLTRQRLVLALAIHPDERSDLVALASNGWRLVRPTRVAHTPAAYRRFIQRSRAEVGIAKSGYVAAQCGWFSDRSVCYLASGRPVVAQDTGFGPYLPTGAGLLAFSTAEQASAAIEEVAGDYARHARASRAIAEEYFAADRVLTRLLRQVDAA